MVNTGESESSSQRSILEMFNMLTVIFFIVGVVVGLVIPPVINVLRGRDLELADVKIIPTEGSPTDTFNLRVSIQNLSGKFIQNVTLTIKTVPGIQIFRSGVLLNSSQQNGELLYTRTIGALEAAGQFNRTYSVTTPGLEADEDQRTFSMSISVYGDGQVTDTKTVEFVVKRT